MTIEEKFDYLEMVLKECSFFPIDQTKKALEFYYYHDKTIVFDFSDYDFNCRITMQNYLFQKFYRVGVQKGQNQIKDRVNYLLNNDIWLP